MAKTAKIRVRKRGKTYSYSFEVGVEGGVRKRCEKGGFPSADEAYEAGAAAFNNWKHGNIGIVTPKISLDSYLGTWLESYCSTSVKEATFGLYKSMIKHHISPVLGKTMLQELTPAMVDHCVSKMARKGLAYKTISLALAVLRNALNYAVHPGCLIQSNPALYVKVPRNAPKNIVKRTIVTPKDMSALMGMFPQGHPAHIPVLLLYHTGMRIGEAIGLAWDDVDLDAGTISVQKQLRYINERHAHYFSTPKTEAGIRTIYIDPFLISELQTWRARQQANEDSAGGSYVYNYRCTAPEDKDRLVCQSKGLPAGKLKRELLICTKENGSVVTPDVARWHLRQAGLNSHSFRHTQATILIENGAAPKGVAGRLGHSSVAITQDLYAHDTSQLRQGTAAVFASAVGRDAHS
jgi:integrase